MPANKSHHYVPQMYMRLFSTDRSRVGVYVIGSGKRIPNAPIHGQACRDYFYGKDPEVERAFGRMESETALLFANAVERLRLPEPGSRDHEQLIFYLGLQHSRTMSAAEQHNEASVKAIRAMLRRKATLEGNDAIVDALDRVIIRRNNAVSNSVSEVVSYAAIGANLLTDLTFVLVRNDSPIPFIASDAPVVLHNRLYEGQHIAVIGYANVGLQLFLPLGPRLALLGYDAAAYHVANEGGRIVGVADAQAVRLINDLQWESAHAVLLTSRDVPEEELGGRAAHWAAARKAERAVFREELVEQSETQARRGRAMDRRRLPSRSTCPSSRRVSLSRHSLGPLSSCLSAIRRGSSAPTAPSPYAMNWRSARAMDSFIAFFDADFPHEDVAEIGDRLLALNCLVPGFVPPKIGLLDLRALVYAEHVDRLETVLLVDRNLASRMAQLASEGAPRKWDKPTEVSINLMAFAQAMNFDIEPGLAFHELAHRDGNSMAQGELSWFRAADRGAATKWIDVAMRRAQTVDLGPVAPLEAHDMAAPLLRWTRNYVAMLKIAELGLTGGRALSTVLSLLDWMIDDFILAGPAFMYAAPPFPAPGCQRRNAEIAPGGGPGEGNPRRAERRLGCHLSQRVRPFVRTAGRDQPPIYLCDGGPCPLGARRHLVLRH